MSRKNSPGNLTPIMELSWKSHGILFYSFRGNPGTYSLRQNSLQKASFMVEDIDSNHYGHAILVCQENVQFCCKHVK